MVVSTTPTNCTVRVDNLVDKNSNIKVRAFINCPAVRVIIF
jgi:hypothetical protein